MDWFAFGAKCTFFAIGLNWHFSIAHTHSYLCKLSSNLRKLPSQANFVHLPSLLPSAARSGFANLAKKGYLPLSVACYCKWLAPMNAQAFLPKLNLSCYHTCCTLGLLLFSYFLSIYIYTYRHIYIFLFTCLLSYFALCAVTTGTSYYINGCMCMFGELIATCLSALKIALADLLQLMVSVPTLIHTNTSLFHCN